ncbi:uncharacterized protein [Drosophila takahashii]|uniref:uncharacterized protein n=1 Tax=Drosophila takahashii TaxID=29030 RepID=UPI001CF87538|nr:uncharacterized protein LOC123003490 [Drosophila takahashii]
MDVDANVDVDVDADMHVKRLEWNGAKSVPGKRAQSSTDSGTNIVHIHIHTDQRRQGHGRFTQLMDLLPLGSTKLATRSEGPSINPSPNPNQCQTSISSSLGSPNLSFHSEELLLDMETGEEFHELHR